MKSSNPTLNSNTFTGFGRISEADSMTIGGTVNKSAILLLLVMLPAAWIWNLFIHAGATAVQGWLVFGMIAGFVLALVTVFKKEWAPITAPLYAVAQGVFLGGISAVFNASYPGIVIQAIGLTFSTLAMMLLVYKMEWISPSENFKLGIVAATGGIALLYFVGFILSFFGINLSFIYGNGTFGIIFSVVVVVIAALNFILDFDFIQQGAQARAPKYMEWYGAFALMVTLIWLYMEILRLLSKLRSRD
jgi:uncharacterized YccA/Bax inhibitor family protein